MDETAALPVRRPPGWPDGASRGLLPLAAAGAFT
jgi:hypothetical protein